MAATTVRCWLMRLGLWALRRPLERADDWAYLIDHTVQIGTVKCFAVVVRQVRRHGIDRDTVAELRRRLDAMGLGASGREVAEAMLGFVADQAWVARLGGERLIGSTEVLESLFGGFKGLQGQQSDSGLEGLLLVLGALVGRWEPEEIERGLEATPWKAVESWVEEQIGLTVQSRRRTLQAIFSDP
jgi:hypothetical protein